MAFAGVKMRHSDRRLGDVALKNSGRMVFLGCLILTLWSCTMTERLTDPSVTPPIYGMIYKPADLSRHPGVIFLHGVYAIHPDQHAFAQTLAMHGYVVLLLDYYRGNSQGENAAWKTYEKIVKRALAYLQHLPEVDPGRIGIVGFSQGAFLAVSTAGAAPAVRAVVAFYGGAPRNLERYVHRLPPTLILHGDQDDNVPVAGAYRLHEEMVQHGRTAEIHVYPGVAHSFNQAGIYFDGEAKRDAQERTLSFLDRHLKGD